MATASTSGVPGIAPPSCWGGRFGDRLKAWIHENVHPFYRWCGDVGKL